MNLLSEFLKRTGITEDLARLGPLPSRRNLLLGGGLLSGALAATRAKADDVPFSATRWLVNRITYGLTETELTQANTLGYSGYLEYHLNYTAMNDNAVTGFCNLYPTTTMSAPDLALISQPSQQVRELQMTTIYRAVNSKRQLYEKMVEFWCDHFNIDMNKGYCPWVGTVMVRDAIRPNALGMFPAMLAAVAHQPSMLMSLDNDISVAGDQNENYARELMELHTLGSDGGYTQEDVKEVARCFTGWTRWEYPTPGLGLTFKYDGSKHDTGQKTVLGQVIPAGGGQSDAEAVLNILANHPNTAKFIAKKLCRWFHSYDPPASLVNAVAATYTSTGGDIKQMVRTLFNTLDPATTPTKLKRPYHALVSMMRATGAVISDPYDLLYRFSLSGQMPFNWGPPDGYPDKLNAWAGAVLGRWNFAQELMSGFPNTTVNLTTFLAGATDPDAIMNRIDSALFGGAMPSAEKNRVKQYLLVSPGDAWRWREAIGLALATPTFQWY